MLWRNLICSIIKRNFNCNFDHLITMTLKEQFIETLTLLMHDKDFIHKQLF